MRNFIILVCLFLLVNNSGVFGENPSWAKSRRGQVSASDDQIQYSDGDLLANATGTVQLIIEQNGFIFAPANSQALIGFSADGVSPITPMMKVLPGESLYLPFEVPKDYYLLINFDTATGSYRFFSTGRSDRLPTRREIWGVNE